MAAPTFIAVLMDTVTPAARAAWGTIQAAAASGMSGNATVKLLRDVGMGARAQDVLSLFRAAVGANLARSDIARLPQNLLMPIGRVRTAATKIVAPFGYTVKLTLRNLTTGEETTVLNTAHSNQLQAASDVVQAYINALPPEYPVRNSEVIDGTVTDVYRSGAAGYL